MSKNEMGKDSYACLRNTAAQASSVSPGNESRVREERLKRQLAIAERLTRRYREALHELAQ